ncbi:hypothetical protein ACXR6G_04385 [Ancylomarina sp. YFZ004]
MKKKLQIPILLVLFCCLTMPFKSCVDSDDYDFDKLSDKIDWQPNFVAPVGYGEYSLWYLLNQHKAVSADQTIVLGDDGLIHIKYTEANIFEYSVDEVLEFPNDNQLENDASKDIGTFPNGSQLLGDKSFNVESNFAFETGDSQIILSEVTFGANLNFTISNPINKNIEIKVSLHDLVDNNLIEEKLIDVVISNSSQSFVWNLSGTTLPFVIDDNTTQNTVKINFEILVKDDGVDVVSSGSQLGISYKLQDVNFDVAKGDFGDQTIDIGSGDIDLGVDFWDDIDGEFTFADPSIKLVLNNKVGVPFKVLANMTASNSDGVTLNLDPLDQLPDYPKTEAEVLEGIEVSIIYNKDNSQIVPFMALPPSGNITYSGSVIINPLDYNPLAPGNDINIITGTSSISADLEMDIPMDFKADNLSISDTIDEVDIDDAEKMIKAAIIITSENGLPLDVIIENVLFTDASFAVLSTISNESIIKAAGVTATGEVDASTITKEISRIELTADQIKSLNDTENIIIKASVNTSGDGTQSVKLKGTDKLKFSIAVNAQLDLSK